jgi:uncharacterized membrane protein
MQRVEREIEVNRPLRAVYDQWTQFKDFPRFMPGVTAVQQIDDTHLHWKALVWGKAEEWDAEITEQEPDKRISWKTVSGVYSAGTVRFDAIDDSRTRVRLAMAYRPRGAIETAGDAIGLVDAHVMRALGQFKQFIEQRQVPTGGWRGEVSQSTSQGQPL